MLWLLPNNVYKSATTFVNQKLRPLKENNSFEGAGD
jgi:hypothetical protein